MSEGPAKRRWFSYLRQALAAFVLWQALGAKGEMRQLDIVPEFEAIRKRKAKLDEKLFSTPKRRWFWHRMQGMSDGRKHRHFRFGLRTLFVVVTALSVNTGVLAFGLSQQSLRINWTEVTEVHVGEDGWIYSGPPGPLIAIVVLVPLLVLAGIIVAATVVIKRRRRSLSTL